MVRKTQREKSYSGSCSLHLLWWQSVRITNFKGLLALVGRLNNTQVMHKNNYIVLLRLLALYRPSYMTHIS